MLITIGLVLFNIILQQLHTKYFSIKGLFNFRFSPTQDLPPWPGVLQATSAGPACPQTFPRYIKNYTGQGLCRYLHLDLPIQRYFPGLGKVRIDMLARVKQATSPCMNPEGIQKVRIDTLDRSHVGNFTSICLSQDFFQVYRN